MSFEFPFVSISRESGETIKRLFLLGLQRRLGECTSSDVLDDDPHLASSEHDKHWELSTSLLRAQYFLPVIGRFSIEITQSNVRHH